jgi:hypothetical protein
MLAVRKVLKVKNNEVHLHLPPELNNTEVEVFVFNIPEASASNKIPAGITFGGKLPFYPGEDIESELKSIRSEWEMPAC